MDDRQKKVGIGLGGGSLLAVLYSIDPVHFVSYFNEAIGHQLVQFSLVFALAAYVHRRGMRKDNAKLTDAINNLGDALREELTEMRSELVGVKTEQIKTNSRVEALEKLKE